MQIGAPLRPTLGFPKSISLLTNSSVDVRSNHVHLPPEIFQSPSAISITGFLSLDPRLEARNGRCQIDPLNRLGPMSFLDTAEILGLKSKPWNALWCGGSEGRLVSRGGMDLG